VHSGNLTTGQIDDAVTLFTQQALFHGVEKGYGLQMKNVDYDTPDHVMLAKLEKDTYYFSAAKNYWNVKELNYALIDDDGKVKSFSKFKEAAAAINEKYNVNYLKAEYNHAIASSTMARQWEDIKKASGSHPFLKYVTAGDANVRPEHAAMRGVIRRWDDAFWNTHYPPNGWLCRCDVEPMTDSAKATPADKLPSTDGIPTLFQTNTAKDGIVYPKNHPYRAMERNTANEINLKADKMLFKEQQRFAIEHLRDGKAQVTRKELDSPISFSRAGIKDAFNMGHPHKAEKNNAIKYMDQVLETAIYEGAADKHKKNNMVKAIHIFSFFIKKKKSYAIIRQLITGEHLFYSISDSDNILNFIIKKAD
jgi:SPP1 gp7 family putative phage head morphogenesis protein